MKNLLSKITKPILVSALSLGLSSGIAAQKPDNPKFKFNYRFGYDMGISNYKNYKEELTPSSDWEKRFQPSGGTMKLTEKNPWFRWDFFLGLEPAIKKQNFEIGLPIYFYTSNIFPIIQSKLMVDWWDPVAVQDVVFKKKTPSFGISVKLGDENPVLFQILNYNAKVVRRDYDGIDCWGCRNTSKVYEKKTLDENLWVQKFSVGIHRENYEESGYIGLYFERAKGFSNFGFNVSFDGFSDGSK